MLTSVDGRQAGLLLEDSSATISDLDTRLSSTGVDATASTLIAGDWLADRHQLGLSLDDDSTATVRTFAASGGTGSADALGGAFSCGVEVPARGCKPQPTTVSRRLR